ncbi:hypothetical protein LQW54_013347 [Pestalotiopsis sp. IQ-011]
MSAHILIGSGTWGHAFSIDEVRKQLGSLDKLQCRQVDTAALYPFTSPGEAERLLGEIGHEGLLVDTKAMWYDNGDNTLTFDAVQKSINESLERLRASKVNIFYPIGPDHKTPLEEQAAALDAVYRQGKYAKIGLCNYSPEAVEEFLDICDRKGYVKPSAFQGQYNLLCRIYETTLLPILRKHNIAFIAYSALPGSMLSGKVTLSNNDPEVLWGTRFEVSKDNLMGLRGRSWYDKPSFHHAIRQLSALCETHGVDMVKTRLRWILHHSALDGGLGDGVIIGPRNQQQLDAYAAGIHGGPLPEALVKGINDLWEGVAEDAASILVY